MFVEVWKNVLVETLREFSYMASMAEMEVFLSVYHDNLNIQWKGYNDTLSVFVEETLQRLKSFDPSANQDTFNQVKEKLL